MVDGLLTDAAERDAVDIVADYALLLPAQIISEMLGMPHADIPQLRTWSHAMTKTLDPLNTPDEEAAAVDATRAMLGYVEQVITDKRAHPADDILTALIEAEETGDRLSTDELLAQIILLYIAGHETTLNLIGNGLTHLFEFRDQLDRLRMDPNLDANAIEELLRFDSPVQFARRIAKETLEIEGVTIPAGSVISLSLAAANRDPRKWGPTADIVDLNARERTSTSPSAAARTTASAPRSPGSKDRSRSRNSSGAFPTSARPTTSPPGVNAWSCAASTASRSRFAPSQTLANSCCLTANFAVRVLPRFVVLV